jgi:hypothetical protein
MKFDFTYYLLRVLIYDIIIIIIILYFLRFPVYN